MLKDFDIEWQNVLTKFFNDFNLFFVTKVQSQGGKKFEKISIQEIADSAMINRATFYAHYADKQDLYDSLIDQFLASFTGILDEQNLVDGNNVHVK